LVREKTIYCRMKSGVKYAMPEVREKKRNFILEILYQPCLPVVTFHVYSNQNSIKVYVNTLIEF